MEDLDKLMKVKGVWAAGEFSPDGKLIAYKGNISEEHARMAVLMCAANTLMAEMETQGWTAFTGQEWTPLIGWAVAGPKCSVCVIGNAGVIVNNGEVSFNESI